jgi:uncharacterized membrane protein
MKTSAPANAATSTGLTFETLLLVARPSRFLPRLLTGAATLTLAGTFAYAGIEKLLAPAEFASAIANYRLPLFPASAIHATAFVLPVLEVVLAAALFVPALRRAALVGVGGLLTIFIAGIIQAFARGLVIDCGCFGAATAATTFNMGVALARDAALLAGAVALLHFNPQPNISK